MIRPDTNKKDVPLWSPSASDLSDSNIARYADWLSRKTGKNLRNYQALHSFSVQSADQFWVSIWEYFDVKGTRGESAVSDLEKLPGARWFPDSSLNFAENMLRHCKEHPSDVACVEHNEDGLVRSVTYSELYAMVAKLAKKLRELGVTEGDRVAAISTNSHHAIVGMLATSSIGAIWSSCSPDFGASGILDRFEQIEPKILITCLGYKYAGKALDCRDKAGKVADRLLSLEAVIYFDPLNEHPSNNAALKIGRLESAISWDSIVECISPIEEIHFTQVAFNAPLYILYSSGTTGKPKCIVHGVGGTLLQHLKELALHTDVKAGTRLFYFTTCGWMMWNWYVSGLALGASLILYDGSPFHPEHSVLFDLAESEGIEVFGASAKYFAAAEKFGLKPKQTHNLENIKGILSTGSPLVPESFDYLYRDVSSTARVSSISGGTDIVSCFALGCPILPVWRGELQCAGLGMDISFLDENGSALVSGKGELVCKTSFPSMPVSFWKDADGQRYFNAYFASHPNKWAHGDFGELCIHQLEDGTTQTGVMIHGRSDAVLNPNGVRIGTAEIYRQVEKVDAVFESLAIGQKWQGDERIVLFVKLRDQIALTSELEDEIRTVIRSNTSPRHVPAKIIAVRDIPRTRSGKIVELAVRAIVHGEPVKNTEALANPEALELFKNLSELET